MKPCLLFPLAGAFPLALVRGWRCLVSLLLAACLWSQSGLAQSPAGDAFNPSPDGLGVYALAVQPDGKIIIGGEFTYLGAEMRQYVARLNADGTLDTTLPGASGGTGGGVGALALQADGSIIMGGDFTEVGGIGRNRLARVTSNGTLDASFNPDANDTVWVCALQPDGTMLVAGEFTELGGQTRNRIARLDTTGALDTGFSPDVDDSIWTLALQSDGKILVGGDFHTIAGETRNHLARLNADGTLDTSFTASADSPVFCITVQADGKILVGGEYVVFDDGTHSCLARLNADGTRDDSFVPHINSTVGALAVQADGKILIGGDFSTVDGYPRSGLARLNPDGSLDPAFSSGVTGYTDWYGVWALALQADGKLLVGGNFSQLAGTPRSHVGRLYSTSSAIDTLSYRGATITWQRGGTAPEVWRTTFEHSTNGTTWTSLGTGTRIAGGWQLTSVPASVTAGTIRARGYVLGSCYGSPSGSIVEITTTDFDTDSDGLTDSWERQCFANSLAPGPTGDYDGDGLTNRQEYDLGTNPAVGESDWVAAGDKAAALHDVALADFCYGKAVTASPTNPDANLMRAASRLADLFERPGTNLQAKLDSWQVGYNKDVYDLTRKRVLLVANLLPGESNTPVEQLLSGNHHYAYDTWFRDTWDHALPDLEELLAYDVVVWEISGWGEGMTAEQESLLRFYMAAGGALLLCGDGILNTATESFQTGFLHVSDPVLDLDWEDAEMWPLNGAPNDPIADGLSVFGETPRVFLAGMEFEPERGEDAFVVTGEAIAILIDAAGRQRALRYTDAATGGMLVFYAGMVGIGTAGGDLALEAFVDRALRWLGAVPMYDMPADLPTGAPAVNATVDVLQSDFLGRLDQAIPLLQNIEANAQPTWKRILAANLFPGDSPEPRTVDKIDVLAADAALNAVKFLVHFLAAYNGNVNYAEVTADDWKLDRSYWTNQMASVGTVRDNSRFALARTALQTALTKAKSAVDMLRGNQGAGGQLASRTYETDDLDDASDYLAKGLASLNGTAQTLTFDDHDPITVNLSRLFTNPVDRTKAPTGWKPAEADDAGHQYHMDVETLPDATFNGLFPGWERADLYMHVSDLGGAFEPFAFVTDGDEYWPASGNFVPDSPYDPATVVDSTDFGPHLLADGHKPVLVWDDAEFGPYQHYLYYYYGYQVVSYYVYVLRGNGPFKKYVMSFEVYRTALPGGVSQRVATISPTAAEWRYTDDAPPMAADEIQYSLRVSFASSDGSIRHFDTPPQRYVPDSDDDGVPDQWERQYFGTLDEWMGGDYDEDGLSNRQEYDAGTSPANADSDADGMRDGREPQFGYDPLDPADGAQDDDADGLPNGWELTYDLNPRWNDDADWDFDGDGMTNLMEYAAGKDPFTYEACADFVVTITLTARAADQTPLAPPSHILCFGMHSSALDAVDELDFEAPPDNPDSPVTLKFTNNSGATPGSGLFTDMRRNALAETWVLNVTHLPDAATVTLEWSFSSGQDPYLPDYQVPADAVDGALGSYSLIFSGNGPDVDMKRTALPRSVTLTRNGDFTVALFSGTGKAPIAIADAAVTLQNTVTSINVLANDRDPDSDPLQVSLDPMGPGPFYGIANVNSADQTIIYTPDDGFVGQDSFTYQLYDGHGNLAEATVTVNVEEKYLVTRSHRSVAHRGKTFTVNLNVTYAGSPTGLSLVEFLPAADDTFVPWAYVADSLTMTVGTTTAATVNNSLTLGGLNVSAGQSGSTLTVTFTGTPFALPANPNSFVVSYKVLVPGTEANLSTKVLSGHAYEGDTSGTVVAVIPQTGFTVRTATLDINENQVVDFRDVVLIYRSVRLNKTATTGLLYPGYDPVGLGGATIQDNIISLHDAGMDVNGNGVVDFRDVVLIYQYVRLNKRADTGLVASGYDPAGVGPTVIQQNIEALIPGPSR